MPCAGAAEVAAAPTGASLAQAGTAARLTLRQAATATRCIVEMLQIILTAPFVSDDGGPIYAVFYHLNF